MPISNIVNTDRLASAFTKVNSNFSYVDGRLQQVQGVAFGYNAEASTGTSFAYYEGAFTKLDGTVVSLPAGTVSLSNGTNYIQLNFDATSNYITSNTSGFTTNYKKLWKVVVTSGAITAVTDYRIEIIEAPDALNLTGSSPTGNPTATPLYVQTDATTGKIPTVLIPDVPTVNNLSAVAYTTDLEAVKGKLVATSATTGLLPTQIIPDAPSVDGFSAVSATASGLGTSSQANKLVATDSTGKLPVAIIPAADAASLQGATVGTSAGQIALLDATGKVPSSLLPGINAASVNGFSAYPATDSGLGTSLRANVLVATGNDGKLPLSVLPQLNSIDVAFNLAYLGF